MALAKLIILRELYITACENKLYCIGKKKDRVKN